MDRKFESFFKDALLELIKNNVDIHLSNTETVKAPDGDSDCAGYFDGDASSRTFACAMDKSQKRWIPIFLHEYCHFRQWKEGAKVWRDMKSVREDDLWDYISGNLDEISDEVITVIRDVELDCEKRVVGIIEQYKLNIDIQEYIKSANAYVFFYNTLKENRRWSEIATPYEVKEILDIMPDVFVSDYNKTPTGYNKLVKKFCF